MKVRLKFLSAMFLKFVNFLSGLSFVQRFKKQELEVVKQQEPTTSLVSKQVHNTSLNQIAKQVVSQVYQISPATSPIHYNDRLRSGGRSLKFVGTELADQLQSSSEWNQFVEALHNSNINVVVKTTKGSNNPNSLSFNGSTRVHLKVVKS